MKVRWSRRAILDLQAFHDWLSTLERAKPDQTIQRIRAAARIMERLGDIGRPSSEPGVKELSVRTAPYVIAYRVASDVIEIIGVYHTSQER